MVVVADLEREKGEGKSVQEDRRRENKNTSREEVCEVRLDI